ncbi:uncharacterized protein LOC118191602 [Stegodyphus dumicola]|nr:uncharacterized protein LOC118191602 [Stegodyphus dumicola]
MFQKLKELCSNLHLNFQPEIVVADFEYAIHEAVRKMWPECSITGCRFHLTQAWWRKLQQCGLQQQYRNGNSEIGRWLRLVFGLPFLDATEVSDSFVEDLMSEQPRDANITRFTDYITENYLDEDAKFPPILWACADISSERTTNACEAFHSKFRANFYHSHPNIFVFTDVIRQIQIDIYAAINGVKQHKKITNRNYANRKERIEDLLNKRRYGMISRLEFLRRVSCYPKIVS